jgi:hypothetical protein
MSHLAEYNEIMISNTEFEKEVTVMHLGSLADFGLGNEVNGIPSELAGATLKQKIEYGESLKLAVAEVTDLCHYGCIDGRMCKHNADGSNPEVRSRQVGGTGLLVEVALNSDASILDTIEDKDNVGQVITVVEEHYENVTGIKRSAHLGGCGGVKHAIANNRAIANKPAIMNTVEGLMNIPAIQQHTGLTFGRQTASHISQRAEQTANWLEQHQWDGDTYVRGVEADEPSGVENLETADDAHHGHKESAVVFFLSSGDKKKSLSDELFKKHGISAPFVINVDVSFEMAKALSGQQGQIGVTKAFTANLAKHAAIGDALASPDTPVYFMAA